tara:strand:+ start:322 stop:495 length:174 start_codon:yes stop_codon:yes gene_type:complete
MTSITLQESDFTQYAKELGIWSGILEDNNLPSNTEQVTLIILEAKFPCQKPRKLTEI